MNDSNKDIIPVKLRMKSDLTDSAGYSQRTWCIASDVESKWKAEDYDDTDDDSSIKEKSEWVNRTKICTHTHTHTHMHTQMMRQCRTVIVQYLDQVLNIDIKVYHDC